MATAVRLGKRERTRNRIALCALELFEENGYDQTTVATITKTAGISHMTFFRNFPTRVDLVDSQIPCQCWEQLIATAPLTATPADSLLLAWPRMFECLGEVECDLLVRWLYIIAGSRQLCSTVFGPGSRWSRSTIEALRERGSEADQARVVSAMILGAIAGMLTEHSAEPHRSTECGSACIGDIAETVAAVAKNGLALTFM